MNPRERLRRATEDGERIYRAYMHGDIEDMTAADLNRLSGILTLDLPDALGAYDSLERAYRQACTNLATIRPDLTRDMSVGEMADLYYDALLSGWGGVEGYDPGRTSRKESYSERLRREGGMAASGKFREDSNPASVSEVADMKCECGGCKRGDHNFDRSLCACGAMHYYCNECGFQCEDCDPASERLS